MKHPHAVLVQPSKHPPPASIDPCRSQVNLDIKSNQEAETAVSRLFFECVWIWLFTESPMAGPETSFWISLPEWHYFSIVFGKSNDWGWMKSLCFSMGFFPYWG
jgi:hypothetical protein